MFDQLKRGPIDRPLRLETTPDEIAARVIDLCAPLGKGQRGLIVSPPDAGKTTLLRTIALAIEKNHPECVVLILLLGECPEDIQLLRRSFTGPNVEVISTELDALSADLVRISTETLDRAKRLVAEGKDVVLLIDSINRLTWAMIDEAPPVLKIGGLSKGWHEAIQFFRAACSIVHGGSLTIVAMLQIETGSRKDDMVHEEFRCSSNWELNLDGNLANRRIWPAIDLNRSGTRNEHLLRTDDELPLLQLLRQTLADIPPDEAMQVQVRKLKATSTNAEFIRALDMT